MESFIYKGVIELYRHPGITGSHPAVGASCRWSPVSQHRWIALSIFVLTCGLAMGQVHGEQTHDAGREYAVVLFTGSGENNPFWNLFTDFMQEAADDLEIKLDIRYADGSRKEMVKQVRAVCAGTSRPDAIVVQSFKRTGPDILRIAERYRMPVFLVNSGLTATEKKMTGNPREELKFWIGEMLPKDFDAGYQLANALIDEAKKDPRRIGRDGKVHVIGLNGIVSHQAARAREAGLTKAIEERPDEAVLDQVVAADWDQELAFKRCRFLHRRYPEASVIWSASDHMAQGAIRATQDRDLITDRNWTVGEDVIIGGVDASREAMKLIDEGTLYATVGGHFMEGAWVMVLLHDYFHGVELDRIPAHYDSPMSLVTRNNLAVYRELVEQSVWESWDFRKLSRLHTPKLKSYSFDPKSLLSEHSAADSPVVPSGAGDAGSVDSGGDP